MFDKFQSRNGLGFGRSVSGQASSELCASIAKENLYCRYHHCYLSAFQSSFPSAQVIVAFAKSRSYALGSIPPLFNGSTPPSKELMGV